jgi:subtilisin family serine protease
MMHAKIGRQHSFRVLIRALALTAVTSAVFLPGRWHEPAWAEQGTQLEQAADHGPIPPERFPARQRALHMDRLGVTRWQEDGFRGQGIKVAILDSGFRGYRAHLGKALPANVMCKSFRTDGNLEAKDSQHGILCGEVIHALAPDADLLFANWEADRPDRFLDAVRWARQTGARVISCSLIMPSWSDGEGGGSFSRSLSRILGDGNDQADVLFFASAGNTAERHWSGSFRAGRDGLHEWRPGQTRNELVPFGTDGISVELYGAGEAGYELLVKDSTGQEVGHSRQVPDKTSGARAVRFTPEAGASYQVQVRLAGGRPGPFHLVVLGGRLGIATANGSVPCPADNPVVVAVGAVTNDGERFAYSSCGPNSKAPKPDLVAPTPIPSLWRARPFSGTSAAAPQAAALAALWWSRHPNWTPAQVRQSLQHSARDLGPPGHDWETGYGQITLP